MSKKNKIVAGERVSYRPGAGKRKKAYRRRLGHQCRHLDRPRHYRHLLESGTYTALGISVSLIYNGVIIIVTVFSLLKYFFVIKNLNNFLCIFDK